jgi:hypothetical protein
MAWSPHSPRSNRSQKQAEASTLGETGLCQQQQPLVAQAPPLLPVSFSYLTHN